MIIGFTIVPVTKHLDIRGWREMHPLNGPGWSLFFEYIANIAFILIFIRLSNRWLTLVVVISAAITLHYALTNNNGDIIGGWVVDDFEQMRIGFTRLLFPFTIGLLMARAAKLKYTKNAYLVTSLLLVGAMLMPRFSADYDIWNRLYECFCLMAVFPLIIWLGAGGSIKGPKTIKFCNFMGNISYPLYMTHFPIAYLYMAYVKNNNLTFSESWPWMLTAFVTALFVAYISMKYFDAPVRKWLTARFIKGDKSQKFKIAPQALLQYVNRKI